MDGETSKIKSTSSQKESNNKQQKNNLEENDSDEDVEDLKLNNFISYNSDLLSLSNKKHRHVKSTNITKDNINLLSSPKKKSSPKIKKKMILNIRMNI